VASRLDAAGVGYGVYYPLGTHQQPPYAGTAVSLPETERAAAEVLSIPVRPDLTETELEQVVVALNNAVQL